MEQKKELNPMEEAYKLIGGDPAQDAVSVAAKGGDPETDKEQRMRLGTQHGSQDEMCMDINEAYAMLFESLAVIMKSK